MKKSIIFKERRIDRSLSKNAFKVTNSKSDIAHVNRESSLRLCLQSL